MVTDGFDRWLERCLADPELVELSKGVNTVVEFEVAGVSRRIALGDLPHVVDDSADLSLRADETAWSRLLNGPHAQGWQSYGAIRRFNDAFDIQAENPLIEAQALASLERMIELAVAPPATPNIPAGWRLDNVSSTFLEVAVDERGSSRLRVMAAGKGRPVLFLHTAGADCRQYFYQLGDPALTDCYRMIAFDLPGHGGSSLEGEFGGTPRGWQATGGRYLAWCRTAIEVLFDEPPIVVGCSAGAAMALTLAARESGLVRGAIGLETPFKARGRLTPFLDHAQVSDGKHNPAWVRALLAPGSPKPHRDEACGIYQQARPGIYAEDLRYYSDEFDAAELIDDLNRHGRPIVLRTGAYDYSATPEDTRRIAEAVPGVDFQVMSNLGHFPMIENPAAFAPWLHEALNVVEERS